MASASRQIGTVKVEPGVVTEDQVELLQRDCGVGLDTDRDYVEVCLLIRPGKDLSYKRFNFTANNTPPGCDRLIATVFRLLDEQGITPTKDKPIVFIGESTGPYSRLLFTKLIAYSVIDPIMLNARFVARMLAEEGKSDKKDAFTLVRLGLSWNLRRSRITTGDQYDHKTALRKKRRFTWWRGSTYNSLGSTLTDIGFPLGAVFPLSGRSAQVILKAILRGERDPYRLLGESFTISLSRQEANHLRQFGGERFAAIRATKNERHQQKLDKAIEILSGVQYLTPNTLDVVESYTKLIETQVMQIDRLNLLANVLATSTPELVEKAKLYATVPTFTLETAQAIIAEYGCNVSTYYKSASAFAQTIGVAPNSMVSAGKVLKSTKPSSNRYIRPLLIQGAAGFLRRKQPCATDEWLWRWAHAYMQRAGRKKATAAIAHKAIKSLYHVDRTGQPYTSRQHVDAGAVQIDRVVKRLQQAISVLPPDAAKNVEIQSILAAASSQRYRLGKTAGVEMSIFNVRRTNLLLRQGYDSVAAITIAIVTGEFSTALPGVGKTTVDAITDALLHAKCIIPTH